MISNNKLTNILSRAYDNVNRNPCLRLGQAIINEDTEFLLPYPWPEVTSEESPIKVLTLIYEHVEDGGRRELSGVLKW